MKKLTDYFTNVIFMYDTQEQLDNAMTEIKNRNPERTVQQIQLSKDNDIEIVKTFLVNKTSRLWYNSTVNS